MSIHLNVKLSRRRFLAGAALLSLPHFSASAFESDAEVWAFLSDTHIHQDPEFIARGQQVAKNLQQVVAEVLAEKSTLSGVLIDGDCAFNEGLKGDYETLFEMLRPLIEAGLPIHLTMGNHDNRGPFFETFASFKSENPPVESKHVALLESKQVNFIFLDSLRFVNKVEGELGQPQLNWLAATLDAAPEKPALLIGHHYPVVSSVKISGLIDSEPFLELIAKRRQAKAYIFGHSHNWIVKTDDAGFHQINLPPTSYVFKPQRPNGWVRATISPSGMKLEVVALDKAHPEHGMVKDLNF